MMGRSASLRFMAMRMSPKQIKVILRCCCRFFLLPYEGYSGSFWFVTSMVGVHTFKPLSKILSSISSCHIVQFTTKEALKFWDYFLIRYLPPSDYVYVTKMEKIMTLKTCCSFLSCVISTL